MGRSRPLLAWEIRDQMPTTETYDDRVSSTLFFVLAAAAWGVVGMSVGVLAAAQLARPGIEISMHPWLTFGRIRPNHTFGVIFAFGGSALMGTCYYVVQRTGHHAARARPARACSRSGAGSSAAVLAMVTMPLGLTQSKEYAEPEWFIDLLIAVVWVSFGVGVLRARSRGGASSTSTWRTGTTAPSSSRSRCCTSSTTSRCRSR